MRRIALATEARYAAGIEDDWLALPELRARGLEPVFADWEDPEVDWSTFEAVILRTTWNYTLRLPAFLAWVDRLPVPLWNPPEIVRWNADKHYLLDLAGWGVPVIPTRVLAPGEDLGGALAALDAEEAVLKPVFGAGARDTWRVRPETAEELAQRLGERPLPMLLQPFVPEIASRGEWSLLYFDGRFGHALLKRAAPGDFRVQEDYGGEVIPADAPDALRRVGAEVLEAVGQDLPYARVDLVEAAQGPLLVEAELIEPELFLRAHPQAPARFASAVARRVLGKG